MNGEFFSFEVKAPAAISCLSGFGPRHPGLLSSVAVAVHAPGVDQLDGGRSAEDDRQRARAIPIIGAVSGGGAIPGSRPGVSRKLGRWSGR